MFSVVRKSTAPTSSGKLLEMQTLRQSLTESETLGVGSSDLTSNKHPRWLGFRKEYKKHKSKSSDAYIGKPNTNS